LNTTSSNAELLVNWIEDSSLSLLNTPGEGTFYRPNMKRPSVLDLTLATTSPANRIEDWQVLPSIGSDHFPVLFTIGASGASQDNSAELADTSTQGLYFNTDKADWPLFQATLASLVTA